MEKKKTLIVSKFIIAAGLLIVIFLPGFSRIQELRSKNRSMEEEISGLKEENKRLEEELARLRDDPEYIEKKARQKMGIVREGEIIYRITPDDAKK